MQPATIEHLTVCRRMHTQCLPTGCNAKSSAPVLSVACATPATPPSPLQTSCPVPASGPFLSLAPWADVLFPNLSPTRFSERASLLTLENLRPSLQPIALFYLPHSTYYHMNLRLFAYRFVVYVPHLLEFHGVMGRTGSAGSPGSLYTML